MTVLAQIATVLRTTEKNALARLQGMKLTPVCGRCGGCGQYSFNGSHSRCYGCDGHGHVRPSAKQLPGILVDAQAAVASGKLDEYLAYLAGRKMVQKATKDTLDAWSNSRVSVIMKGFSHTLEDNAFAGLGDLRVANRKMHDAYEVVSKLVSKCHNTKSPTYRDDCVALTVAVAQALEIIKAVDAAYVAPEGFAELAAERHAAAKAAHAAYFAKRMMGG